MKIVEIYQQRREIDILKMCQHPNIIQLIDYFENESYHFIVLELIKGKNLYDYLQSREYILSEKRVREIIEQIAHAI